MSTPDPGCWHSNTRQLRAQLPHPPPDSLAEPGPAQPAPTPTHKTPPPRPDLRTGSETSVDMSIAFLLACTGSSTFPSNCLVSCFPPVRRPGANFYFYFYVPFFIFKPGLDSMCRKFYWVVQFHSQLYSQWYASTSFRLQCTHRIAIYKVVLYLFEISTRIGRYGGQL